MQDLTTPAEINGSEALVLLDSIATMHGQSQEIKALVEERVRPLVLNPLLGVDTKASHGLTALLRYALSELPKNLGRPLSTLLIALLDPETKRRRPAPEREHQLTTDEVFPGLYDDVLVMILSSLSVPQLVQLSRVRRGFGQATFMAQTWARRFALDFCDAYSGSIMDGAARAIARLEAVQADGLQYQRTYLSYNLLLQCVARLAPRCLSMGDDFDLLLDQQQQPPVTDTVHHQLVNNTQAWTFTAPRYLSDIGCLLGKNIGVRASPVMPARNWTEKAVAQSVAFVETSVGLNPRIDRPAELAQLLVWNAGDCQRRTAVVLTHPYLTVPVISSRWSNRNYNMHPVPVDQLRTVMPYLPPDFSFRKRYYASSDADYILDRSGRFGGFNDNQAAMATYLEQMRQLTGASVQFPFVSIHGAAAATKRPSLVIEATAGPTPTGGVDVHLSYSYMNLDEQARLFATFTPSELEAMGAGGPYPWKRGELLPSDHRDWLKLLANRWTFCDPSEEPLKPEEEDRLCAQARAVMYWPIELLSPMSTYTSRNAIKAPVTDRIATFKRLLEYFYGPEPVPSPASMMAVQKPYYEQLATATPAFVRAIKGAAYYLY